MLLGLLLRLVSHGQLRGGLPAALAGAWFEKSGKPKLSKSLRLAIPQRLHRLRTSLNLINHRDGSTQLTIT
jgi:hypothetical protein